MYKILEIDPYLRPYEKDINLRMSNYKRKRKECQNTCGKEAGCPHGDRKYTGGCDYLHPP